MKLHRSVVALSAAAALVLGMPVAAHAGPGHSKPKVTKAQQQKAAKAKAAAAAKREAARRKAEEARSRFTFPGTVVSVSATGLTISRKERGVVVTRTFDVAPTALVRRDGVRIPLSEVLVGDKVTAQGKRVNGRLVVAKMNVATRVVAPAPVAPATPTATILI